VQLLHVSQLPVGRCPVVQSTAHSHHCAPLHAGPAPAFLLSAVIRGGKTFENGKVGYAGCIRHVLPLLCAHGALARMLCHRFTIKREPFPSLLDSDAWYYLPLWRSSGGNSSSSSSDGSVGNISYEAQNKVLLAAFTALDITVNKTTHAFRVLAARVMDEAGVDDTVSTSARTCSSYLQCRLHVSLAACSAAGRGAGVCIVAMTLPREKREREGGDRDGERERCCADWHALLNATLVLAQLTCLHHRSTLHKPAP
jgi:Centromere DNA-binding protein complex CBF3 subunit, domain 2